MTIIFSEQQDISTDYVMEWLCSMGVKTIRFNEDNSNIIETISIDNQDACCIVLNENRVNLASINSVFYRRGKAYFPNEFESNSRKNKLVKAQVRNHLDKESHTLAQTLYYYLRGKKCINNPNEYNTNKLISLIVASQVGLKIPESKVTRNLNSANLLAEKNNKKIINKTLCNSIILEDKTYFKTVGTVLVNKIKSPSPYFYYSLFQTQINRICDLRIFYLENTFFPMAIFVDEKTIDARSLRMGENMARMVPFKLPLEIEQKLHQFMLYKNINCGSIDMMLNKNHEYVFLEVNPVGQYDYVEAFCNYPISKTIADKLAQS
jgi:glutathione synthase/RimK-type ligase-like ATP-grasp enzyme